MASPSSGAASLPAATHDRLAGQNEATGAIPADSHNLADRACRKHTIDVRILLTARLRSFITHGRRHAFAVDNKYYEFAGVCVSIKELGHGAKLVTKRAMN